MMQPGKRVQLYTGLEDSYGTPPTLAVTHAMRHLTASFDGDPKNRVFTQEKKAGPGRFAMFDRRETAAFSGEGYLRPSGTLNTLGEFSPWLEAAFGNKTNITLSATVDVGTGAVGQATLSSTTGLVAKTTAVAITCPDGKIRVRRVATLPGSDVVTWTPNLPAGQDPDDGAAVKGATCYVLTAALAKSLFLARYTFEADLTAGFSEIVKGALVDRLSLMFDWQDEPRLSVSGPGKTRTTAPAQPGGFTQVGSTVPSAITSEIMIGNNLIRYLKVALELTNGMVARNDENDASSATEGYRMTDRVITAGLDMHAENDYQASLYDLALAGTEAGLFKQTGYTEGKILAVHAPRVYWRAPTNDVGDGPINWPFQGEVLEEVEDSNDELVFMVA